VSLEDWPVRTIRKLARRLVDADPSPAVPKRGAEPTEAAADVKDWLHGLGDQALGYRSMHILLPAQTDGA
jgi:hypothetical protein